MSIHGAALDFGLTYCSNGDLLQHITDADHFDLETVRFYSAELVEALEQLHIRHVVHRDLKVMTHSQLFVSNLFL